MINSVNQLFFPDVKMLLIKLLKQFLKSMNAAKSSEKHFNKTLILIEDEEENFQSSSKRWICEKIIENDDEKVRDYCHITG